MDGAPTSHETRHCSVAVSRHESSDRRRVFPRLCHDIPDFLSMQRTAPRLSFNED